MSGRDSRHDSEIFEKTDFFDSPMTSKQSDKSKDYNISDEILSRLSEESSKL